jgi:hypothetical protein
MLTEHKRYDDVLCEFINRVFPDPPRTMDPFFQTPVRSLDRLCSFLWLIAGCTPENDSPTDLPGPSTRLITNHIIRLCPSASR